MALKAAGIPIAGVSIGREDDRDTWRIDFAPGATPAEQAAAAQILSGFDHANMVEPKTELQVALEKIATLEAGLKKVDPTFTPKV